MTLRSEYPRPQFVRDKWLNLNGEWDFAFDDANRGMIEHWWEGEGPFDRTINVPFVYQAKKSGIGQRERHDVVWYRRDIEIEAPSDDSSVILHFGAVDYEATVFVNGCQVVHHVGGHTPFEADITPVLSADGHQRIVVRVFDPQDDEQIPRGKQFWEPQSTGIWYTNSTGIWQTVWIETIAAKRLDDVRFRTLFDQGMIDIHAFGHGVSPVDRLRYAIRLGDQVLANGELGWATPELDWQIDFIQNHIFHAAFHGDGMPAWSPEHPTLFDVDFEIVDGSTGVITDKVSSYFGIRDVRTENGMVYLNGIPYYQKLVLDQGYWPEGLLTAPQDADYRKDIELAKSMGFNGCRKHQKMEDPRFLYWADRLGFIVWGECASAPVYSKKAVDRLCAEWAEVVDRDYNHPCILTWVPLNESWGVPRIHTDTQQQHFSEALYHYLHAIDPTRLVESNDGWEQTVTDICAIHNYNHGKPDDVAQYDEYRAQLADRESLLSRAPAWDIYARGFANQGEPILLTEFGGIGFDVSGEPGWGYTSVESADQLIEEYSRIMDALYASSGLWGFCYTQLTDVEQEINGLLTYDRKPKCDLSAIKEINDRHHISRVLL